MDLTVQDPAVREGLRREACDVFIKNIGHVNRDLAASQNADY